MLPGRIDGAGAPGGNYETIAPQKESVMKMLTKWNPIGTSRWDPVRELQNIERRLEHLFEDTPLLRGNGGERETMTLTEWSPAVDITEDEKEFLIKAELPEIKKEEVKVNVENGMLEISGERKFEKEEKNKKYHRIERSYGSFVRSFALPEGVDGKKVRAEFKDGLLSVHLPKSEKAERKAIDVKVE